MKPSVTITIDREACNGCGLCVSICAADILEMRDQKAVVRAEDSNGCGHCAAICPQAAVSVSFTTDDALLLDSVEVEERWIPHGKYDTASLVQLMRSRRSCRAYKDRPVPREVLTDLVKIGTTAPSGTNSQQWNFTILPDRAAVLELGHAISDFFRRLNRMASKRSMRVFSRLFLRGTLNDYYREHYEGVREALKEWDATGRDRLFWGAPALIAISMGAQASCPCEDALLASQNILLAAHSMGYGTCLIGYAVEAMKHDKNIRRKIGIPDDEAVYAVIIIGEPRYRFARPAGRKRVVPRFYPH